MRSVRLLVASVLGLSALAVVPATAAAPAALTAVTTVVATHSGSMDLDLDQDATVRLEKNGQTRDISISGRGRVVYASLSMKSDSADSLGVVRVTYGRKTSTWTDVQGTFYPRGSDCPETTTPNVGRVNGVYEPCSPTDPAPKLVVLHQGHYHLRVMTDGAPVTVRLQLHGLKGQHAVRLTHDLWSAVAPLRVIDSAVGRQVRAEASVLAARKSWGLLSLDASLAPGATLSDQVYCAYAPGPVQPTDYADQCPHGAPFGWGGGLVLNPYRQTPPMFGPTSDELAQGARRVGLSLTDDQGVSFRYGLLALLELEPGR